MIKRYWYEIITPLGTFKSDGAMCTEETLERAKKYIAGVCQDVANPNRSSSHWFIVNKEHVYFPDTILANSIIKIKTGYKWW